MSNVQKNKKDALGALPVAKCPAEKGTVCYKKGVDYSIVEAGYSSLLTYQGARHLRTCLRTWFLHFSAKNIGNKESDPAYYLELDRLVDGIIKNAVYEAGEVDGLRKVVRDFYLSNTDGKYALNSEAMRMRQALIEWFTYSMQDFENRYDELRAFVHMDSFNSLDSVLQIVICAHEDGIDLYAPADVIAAA